MSTAPMPTDPTPPSESATDALQVDDPSKSDLPAVDPLPPESDAEPAPLATSTPVSPMRPAAKPSFAQRLAEPWTRALALQEAESTPEPIRVGLAKQLSLSRQKAEAAEALFEGGHPAEAILLARASLDGVVKAAETLSRPASGDASEAAAWREALQRRGLAPAMLDASDRVRSALSTMTSPLNDDVTPEHAAQLQHALAFRTMFDRALAGAAASPVDLRRSRLVRGLSLGAVLLLGLMGAYFALRRPTGTFATASEYFGGGEPYQPALAIDGRPDTEWLLPDHVGGWLELQISPPRRVDRMSILNAHNPPMNDRATREYAVEVYAHGELARSIEGNFPTLSHAPTPALHDVGVDAVERVRIVVRSSHNYGGGIAEVSFQ